MKHPFSNPAAAAALAGLAIAALSLLIPTGCSRTEGATRESDGTRRLVVYSPHPEDITRYIVREFRQRTGIEVTIIAAGTGELIERMKHAAVRTAGAGAGGRVLSGEADLIWGGGIESLETVTEYFEAVDSPTDAELNPVYLASHRLWRPFSVLPAVVIFNKSLIPEEEWPDSWEDLLSPRFRKRLIVADPEKSGSSYTILATMLYTMKKTAGNTFGGWPYVQRFVEQLGPDGIASSSSMVYRAVAAGDFYAGITFENYALSLERTGSNVGYRYPAEGTSAVPDGIALLAGAKNRAEALEFMEFVLGPDVQKILLPRWQRRPVRLDAEKAGPLLKGKIIRYPVDEAAASRDAILERWKALREAELP